MQILLYSNRVPHNLPIFVFPGVQTRLWLSKEIGRLGSPCLGAKLSREIFPVAREVPD